MSENKLVNLHQQNGKRRPAKELTGAHQTYREL